MSRLRRWRALTAAVGRTRLALVLFGLILFVAPGCRKSAPKGTTPDSGPSAAPEIPVAPRAPAVSDSEARTLLLAWLGAQNRGDFAAYEKLYASRFAGIKRAGPRVRMFDRAGWLKDRARMFDAPAQGSPMVVEIEETVIEAGPTTARVRLVQTFLRGKFKDRGPKELLLAREGGALRIAREEMLASEVGPHPTASDLAVAEKGFFFVIGQGVVLSRNPGRDAARGPLTLLPESNEVFLVRSALDETRVDEAPRRWKGRKLQIFDKNGPTCVATVGELSLLVRVDPHFTDTQAWSGASDENGERLGKGKPSSKAAIAKEAWAMAEPILIGKLGGGCRAPDSESGLAAGWARDPDLPPPAVGTVADEPEGPLRTESERQVRRHPEVAAALKAFAGDDEHRQEGAPEPTIDVNRISSKGGAPALIVARFQNGGGCADFVGLTFIWRVSGPATRPRLTLMNDPPSFAPFTPQTAVDLDGDGMFELLGELGGIGLGEVRLMRPANGYLDFDALSVTSLDCYC